MFDNPHNSNLLGVIDGLAGHVEQCLAAGRIEAGELLHCAGREIPGLDSRDSQRTALEELAKEWRPDIVHVHNVVNPWVLEWAATRRSVLTVQDHRFFCPGRGKLSQKGEICLRPMDDERCAVCFEDKDYFSEILGLTEARLAAAQRFSSVSGSVLR